MKTKKIKSKKAKLVKRIIVWCAVLGLLGWFAALRIDVESDAYSYDYVIPFESRNISKFKPASGKIVLHDIEAVSSEVNQKIKKVHCKVGDRVNEGDILCEFESEDLDDQIERIEKYLSDYKARDNMAEGNSKNSAEHLMQSAQLNVERTKLALDSARKSYDETYSKYSDYFDRCYATSDPNESQMYLNMYQTYQAQLETINEQIVEAQKAYDKAVKDKEDFTQNQKDADFEKSLIASGTEEYEKQLEKLKNEKEHLIVTAPRSGIIAESYAAEGGYSMDGCLFRIGSVGKYKVEAYVSSVDILDIDAGMDASVKTILTGADEIKAKVIKKSDIFSATNNGYAVELEILDDSYMENLRHNANATVKIYSENIGEVPSVQYDAIASDENGESYVYKAVRRGSEYVAEKVAVEKGFESDFYIEVKSSELKDGDLIVGNGSKHKNGDRLKIKGMAG